MSDGHTTLAPFYKGWDAYQGLLTEALAPLSPEQLARRGSWPRTSSRPASTGTSGSWASATKTSRR